MFPEDRVSYGNHLYAVIVGGGITGLSTAWYLEKAAREEGWELSVVLVERDDSLGGKVQTLNEGGFIVESGADGFLTRKPWALELARELGLDDELIYTQSSGASLLLDGKLHPIPRGMMGPAPSSMRDVWKSSFLSLRGKIRASLEPFVGKRGTAQPESLGDFLKRRMGAELTDTLLEPLTAGIYGGDSYDMSLTALFPMLEEWERRYGSLTRGMSRARKAARGRPQPPSAFFSFRSGAHRLARAIADRLRNTRIIRGRSAVSVQRIQDVWIPRYRVALDDGNVFESDVVALAAPASDSAGLVGSFAPNLSRLLGRQEYSATGSVYLAFRREYVSHPLDGTGFLAPRSETLPITGCTWMSSKWSGRSPDDHVLLRAFVGRPNDASFLERDDSELVEAAVGALRPLLGIRGVPERAWVNRQPESMPRYKIDHTGWLEDVDRELAAYPELFLCGSSYRGIGVPDCVRQGRDTAERIRAFALQNPERATARPA